LDLFCPSFTRTYFNEESRLSARREWVISLPGSKKKIGAATSTWVNINMSTRRITKLPDELKEPLRRLAAPESLHSIPVEETKKKLQDFDRGSGVKSIAQIARRSDMDMNGHINNVVYIAWALESIPSAVYDSYHLHEIEVDFKAECKAGDTVQSYVHQLAEHGEADPSRNGNRNGDGKKAAEAAEVVFLHMLERCDEEGCTELVRARSTWRKN
jgi:fatty acyl-ACP thioesterase A